MFNVQCCVCMVEVDLCPASIFLGCSMFIPVETTRCEEELQLLIRDRLNCRIRKHRTRRGMIYSETVAVAVWLCFIQV